MLLTVAQNCGYMAQLKLINITNAHRDVTPAKTSQPPKTVDHP